MCLLCVMHNNKKYFRNRRLKIVSEDTFVISQEFAIYISFEPSTWHIVLSVNIDYMGFTHWILTSQFGVPQDIFAV